MAIHLAQPQSNEEWRRARQLVEEYVASLNLDLSFQNIAYELDNLSSEYSPPAGAFFLAQEDGTDLGCVGLRRFAEGVGEIKRLYTAPAARGRGVGRLLAQSAVASGRHLGYHRLLLDTLPSMREAQSLYTSLGFTPTTAYRVNPVEGTAFLELRLDEKQDV